MAGPLFRRTDSPLELPFGGVLIGKASLTWPAPQTALWLLAGLTVLVLAIAHYGTQSAGLRRSSHRLLLVLLLAGTGLAGWQVSEGTVGTADNRLALALFLMGLAAFIQRWRRRGGWMLRKDLS